MCHKILKITEYARLFYAKDNEEKTIKILQYNVNQNHKEFL